MTVFKRKRDRQHPEAPYYYKFCLRGRQFFASTRTTIKKVAEQRARLAYNAAVQGQWDQLDASKAKPKKEHTFGDLWLVYNAHAAGITSRKRNFQALMRLLGISEDDSLKKLACFHEIESLYLKRRSQCLKDQRSLASCKRSYNAELRAAKSVFAKRYMPALAAKLNLPDLAGFKALSPMRVEKEGWRAPSSAVVGQIVAGLEQLERNRDPIALPILLECFVGMRSKEIVHARWSWLNEDGITIGPDRDFSIKGHATRTIPLAPEIRARINAQQSTMDYMVAGIHIRRDGTHIPTDSVSGRNNVVRKLAVKWVKSQGITDRKPMHALRKLFGSHVLKAQGIYAAQRALGHSSPAVTMAHYADLINPLEPVTSLSGRSQVS